MKSIEDLLKERHCDDVFALEVKDGATQTRRHSRIDALAIKRTWSPVTVVGYEIKRTRGDFLQDEKWGEYLKMCHQLYFATPYGLVKPEEVPAECGLIEASKNSARMRIKKRAPHRKLQIDYDTLMYLFICRTRIGEHRDLAIEAKKISEAERNIKLLELKDKTSRLDYHLGELLGKETAAIHAENERLKEIQKPLEELRQFCKDNNINVHSWSSPAKQLEEIIGDLDIKKFRSAMTTMHTALNRIEK